MKKRQVSVSQPAPKLKPYDPAKIERKWQKKWAASKLYKSKDGGKEKFYVLDMFPYPSGEGLHVGHPKGYIATDVISRMKRMQGRNVLHPMGFDAFGLPAENYAIKTKTNPMVAVAKNVKRFKEQLEILGFDYDWSREVNTTDPDYYRWTQWIFLQLWKKGLAYESYEPVNWCPTDKTVLANEDVENGRCERCGTPVEKKPMRQWVLRITDYADRLLKDLDATAGIPLVERTEGQDGVKEGLPFSERWPVVCIIKHWENDEYLCSKWRASGWQGFVIGGVEGGETPAEAALREIREETGYKNVRFVKEIGKVDAKFYQMQKKVNRHAHFTGLYLELIDGERADVSEEEKAIQDFLWIPKAEVRDFTTHVDMTYLWDIFTSAKKQEIKPLLDWPESIKEAQRNWIGRSEGALIKFKVQSAKFKVESQIEVFTTRPDTLFGVTYVVLAPEHKLVGELLGSISNKPEVDAYIDRAKSETEIERTDASKEKTGVELKGVKAVNPANNEEVPVWIADYVLADYGTGAVMAVPAHDERDWEFAKKFGLPVKHVIVPERVSTIGALAFRSDEPVTRRNCIRAAVKHWSEDKYLILHWKDSDLRNFISGGIEPDEDLITAAMREIKEETGYLNPEFISNIGGPVMAKFYAPNKKQNRIDIQQGLLFKLKDGSTGDVSGVESSKHSFEWVSVSELSEVLKKALVDSVLFERMSKGEMGAFVETGVLINSGKFTGKDFESVKKDITASVGGQWVTKYKLRDWVFSRQRYWGEPIPLIHCEKCGVVPVPENDLPVKLPKVESYEPTGTGESPLAAISKWVNVKCPKCKGPGKRETNTMPQWAGSCWYYIAYCISENFKSKAPISKQVSNPKFKKRVDSWLPVDLYVGGAEHATRHLIYARFWHKFLYDIGAVSTIEPFIKLQSVGLIMGEDGRKMSKRFGNVVNPDDIVKTFGADTLRIYEMFMGPFDQQIAWSTSSMVGPRRFIERVWKLAEKIDKKTIKGNTPEAVGKGTSSITLLKNVENLGTLSKSSGGHIVAEPRATPSSDQSLSESNFYDNSVRIIHKTIKKVTDDIQGLRFNTAISSLMIAANELEKAAMGGMLDRGMFGSYLKLLAPFAPHVTEELWASLGNKKSIHISEWPKHDPAFLVEDSSTIMLQINGKTRGSFTASTTAGKEELEKLASEAPEAQKWLKDKKISRIVAVPGKLVNIVVI